MVKAYKYHVFVCTASGAGEEMGSPADPARNRFCSDKGGEIIREKFWEELGKVQVDYVKVTRMGCTVQHKKGPIVVVYPEGVWYSELAIEDVTEIVQSHLIKGIPVERLIFHRMENNSV